MLLAVLPPRLAFWNLPPRPLLDMLAVCEGSVWYRLRRWWGISAGERPLCELLRRKKEEVAWKSL